MLDRGIRKRYACVHKTMDNKAVAGIDISQTSVSSVDGPRPVNLRTDLGSLADLIEVAFASTMDNSGRAAVREMRALSRVSAGLGMLAGLNDVAQGMRMGYVWIADGKLVGNVTLYPADGRGYDGKTWVIVNVATHPDHQRRGIAHHLMRSSMEMIRERGGTNAILQVDADNPAARNLYLRLGFTEERGWTTWRRPSLYNKPPPLDRQIYITHRRPDEWKAEYNLAAYVRPAALGGLGWLRTLHVGHFRRNLWQRMGDWVSFRSAERLIIRSEDQTNILASLWVENSLMSSASQLTLLVHPDYESIYDEALLNTAVRRFGSAPLSIEHPSDRPATNAILRRYQFVPKRDVIHMRWDID